MPRARGDEIPHADVTVGGAADLELVALHVEGTEEELRVDVVRVRVRGQDAACLLQKDRLVPAQDLPELLGDLSAGANEVTVEGANGKS